MSNTVKIVQDQIVINGVVSGYIGGTSSEVWIYGTDASGNPNTFVARMKYMKPKTKAKNFIKAVFAKVTMVEYLELLKTARSPRDVAIAIGAEY